ncbi:carbonic anhydrase [Pelagicoccus mobilis]|uniref:carbonic anhydrase n=1 Tax=Pelagicoccus mobilis TaxID=415221 RepID=A0A934S355_9BACT|nr:carbonic anhydrase [Pelagicoccus mobilis]MBK1879796.1 hypothetical protein [Pelagicoccus mobilis]
MPANQESSSLPESLREGYQNYLNTEYAEKKDLFATLATKGQSPKVLWIGCVDSRVMPEKILGADPGELLILRNVANMVPPLAADEASVGSVVHFAVAALKVSHIVVCGHSDCGGVKALMNLGKGPMDRMLSSWVEYGVSALEDDSEQSLESVTKTNVVKQAARLSSYPDVAEALEADKVQIHSLFYNIGAGKLEQYDQASSAWADFS